MNAPDDTASKLLGERRADLSLLAKTKTDAIKPTYGNLCILVRHEFGRTLSYDEMALSPCLDNEHIRDHDIGKIREFIEAKHDVSFGHEAIERAILQVSNERSFHPVKSYVASLEWDGERRICRLLPEVLLTRETALLQAYIRCWFVGTVARAIEPGCKFDNVLTLVGPQGIRKSTFFRIMGGKWFADSYFDIKSRQGLLTLAAAWIYEFAEIDSLVGTKEDPDTKRFFTSDKDTFVPPYGRSAIHHPRSSVIVGTTNKDRFLKDHTGNRRYWVVPLTSEIRVDVLSEWRDQLWAEAYELYVDAQRWHLDKALEALQAQANEIHEHQDPWQPIVESFVLGRNPLRLLTTETILTLALNLTIERMTMADERRLGAIMHRLGFVIRRPKIDGRRPRVWTPIDSVSDGEPDAG